MRKFILWVFNSIFTSKVTIEDIDTIRLLADAKLRFSEADIGVIRILVAHKIRFSEEDVNTIKLASKYRLRFQEADVEPIRLFVNEGLEFKDNVIRDIGEGAHLCYSQEGESLILDRLFEHQAQGFFVDVGAHHPKRFSNTYSLYKRGWRGINIEPNPGAEELFRAIRPDDIFLPLAVSDKPEVQEFYSFNEPALNTFDKRLVEEYQRAGYELVEVRPIRAKTLGSVLAECRKDGAIDLMSIDVEGHELQVLQSNDWIRFRPRILLVEILDFDVTRPGASFVHNFLVNQGYALFAKTYNTVFYRDSR